MSTRLCVVLLLFYAMLLPAQSTPQLERALGNFARLPIAFEPNAGRVNENIQFISHGRDYSIYLCKDELLLAFSGREAAEGELVQIALIGTSHAMPQAEGPLPGVTHYYRGGDPIGWNKDIQQFQRVRFSGIYPGIDLVFYGNQQELEFDFDIAPGADPAKIQLKVQGATVQRSKGQLQLTTPRGHVAVLKQPEAYQIREGKRREIRSSYLFNAAHEITFSHAKYDKRLPLVIDPALGYSTLIEDVIVNRLFPGLLPPGRTAGELDTAAAIAADASGNVYIAGTGLAPDVTQLPPPGVSTVPPPPILVAFVLKLDPTGTNLVYLFFASNISFSPVAMTVDSGGNVYLVGIGFSGLSGSGIADFPTTPGAFDATPACPSGTDLTISICQKLAAVKLDSTGKLIYSTYLQHGTVNSNLNGGANIQVPRPTSIAVDPSGAIYVSGRTERSGDFNSRGQSELFVPLTTTPGAFQPTATFPLMAWVIKLSPDGSTLNFGTYLGGSTITPAFASSGFTVSDDAHVAVNAAGEAYLGGTTVFADFPITPGAPISTNSGMSGFFTKLAADGSHPTFSTFWRGSGTSTFITGITTDPAGSAYVTGSTDGSGLPTTPGAFQSTPGPGQSGGNFVSEFDTSGNLVMSTYLGDAYSGDIAVDGTGIYVTADATSSFPLLDSILPPKDGEGVVTKLKTDGSGLIYSTRVFGFLGKMALDGNQDVFLLSDTSNLITFPTTLGALQPVPLDHSANLGFAVQKILPSLGAPVPVPEPRFLNFPEGTPAFQVTDQADAVQLGLQQTRNVVLSNVGDTDLTISGAALSGANVSDFSETTDCGTILPTGNQCTYAITFAPTLVGTRVASLGLSFGGGLPSQTIPITGHAEPKVASGDFLLALVVGQPSSITLIPGQGAFVFAKAEPAAGESRRFTITCTGAPTNSECVLPSGPLISEPQAQQVVLGIGLNTHASNGQTAKLAPRFMPWSTLALAAIVVALSPRRHSRVGLSLVAFVVLGIVSCGGGSQNSGTPPVGTPGSASQATPSGTYTLTFTVTADNGAQHTLPLTITVK